MTTHSRQFPPSDIQYKYGGPTLNLLHGHVLSVNLRNRLPADNIRFKISKRLGTSVDAKISHFREGNSGDKAFRLPGLGNFAVELVDLFEGETFSFVNGCPDKEHADETESSPYEKHLRSEISIARAGIHEVRR